MRDATGGIQLAVIGTCSPEGGAMHDRDDVPNPVCHSCHVVDPGRDVRRIVIETVGLRRGRQMGYSRSRIFGADDPGRLLAITEGQGVSIRVPPEGLEKMEQKPLQIEDSPDLPALWQVFGGQRREDGRWALPELAEELASPDAALHIGPQFVILETAAVDATTVVTGTSQLHGMSSRTMFMARGKVGPFRAEAEATTGPDGAVVARVLLHDEGADERLITAGSYLFRVDR